MGIIVAIVGLVGGVAALFAIETFISGDKSAFYRSVMIGVAMIELVALLISVFFSAGGINPLGTALSIIGIVAVVAFYMYGNTANVVSGSAKEFEDTSSNNET